jgi:hypothetical protein
VIFLQPATNRLGNDHRFYILSAISGIEVEQAPSRDSDDALMVKCCELTTTNADRKMVYRNAWATSHCIDASNIEALAEAGWTRWQIENESNNILKTKGYHFEHNCGHGKIH